MNREIRSYIRAEAIASAAFNFFITGMVVALIFHKADYVPTNLIDFGVDLFIVCMFIGVLTILFSRASLKRTKFRETQTGGGRLPRFISRLMRCAVLFGVLFGLVMFIAMFALIAPILFLFSITEIPFGIYIPVKCTFCALLASGATILELFSGVHKP